MIKYKCDTPMSLFKVGDVISEESYNRLDSDLKDCFFVIEYKETTGFDSIEQLEKTTDMVIDLFSTDHTNVEM